MSRTIGCGSTEHVSRRSFLQGATTGALGMLSFGGMVQAKSARKLKTDQKQVVVFWMTGGVSQLETWDPKPGTDTGGPFQAIGTSVPGVHISELLPYTAKQMHHLSLVRSIDTKIDNHAKGAYFMQTGHPETPGFEYPYIGSAFSSLLAPADNPLPPNIVLQSKTDYNIDSKLPRETSFLGPKNAPVALRGGQSPGNISLPDGFTDAGNLRRRALRSKLGQRFEQGRRINKTEIYNASYEQAAALMEHKELFDFDKLPAKDVQRYGKEPFGRDCLMARQLLEAGVTFVKVRHTDYDSHSENFNFHLEQLGEWDRPFATFVGDLADRGMLKNTLIIVMCEFGRTPKINQRVGRDHWGSAWSIALGGCGIQAGAVVGKTNANGTKVIDREVNAGHLFRTYYEAMGLDHTQDFYHDGRPFKKAIPKTSAIEELLA
jgi:uncharacterized protein (DUF1501 family)